MVLRVTDGTVTKEQNFSITVSNTNDVPIVTSTAVTGAVKDTVYSYTFTASDVDAGDTLTLSAPTLPAWLSFNPSTGVLSGTPTSAQVGNHNVVLRVSDGTVTVDQGFTIAVRDFNNSPTITSTAVTTATEDTAYSYTFTATDPDVGDTLTLSAPTLPAWLSFNPSTGVLSGTPTNAQVGNHSVVLRVTDGTVTKEQNFTITVSNINDAPTITSTAVTAATEGTAYSYTFTVNDMDTGDTLTLSAPTLPAWLSFNPSTGVLSGTPTNAQLGNHAVVLRVSDGTVAVNQSFTITVKNANDAPTITSTAVTTASEDMAYSYTFTVNDVDVGDTLTLSAPTLPAWLSFNPSTGVLSGTPTNAEVGDHNVVLRVSDGTVTEEQRFAITVKNTNDAPAITSTALTGAVIGMPYSYTATATDPDVGDTLTLSAPTLPAWLSFNPSTGVLSGIPTNAQVGNHNVVLRVSDGTVAVDQGFTITVRDFNNSPTITSTAVTGATEGTAYGYTLTATDPDIGDTLTLSAPTLPAWLNFNPVTGVLFGTPTDAEVGDHSVILRVSDGTVVDEQRFTITVSDTNQAPTISSTAVTTATTDKTYSYTFTANDGDAGDTLILSAPTLPAWLSFNPATGVLSGTPTNAHIGNHAVVLRASDGTMTVNQSFTITVSNTNHAPAITSTVVTTVSEDTAFSYTFTATDPDIGDTLTLSAPTLPAWLNFTPSTGELFGTPTNTEVGNHNVVLRVSDGTVNVDQSFTITVSNINDAPVAWDDTLSVTEDNSMTISSGIDLLGNDTDVEGDSLTLSAIAQPNNGTIIDNGDGTLRYTPHDDFYGTDRFTYTIRDNNGGTATGIVTVHVIPVGDTPQVTNPPAVGGQASELIYVRPNANDGSEVAYFKISNIANGTLYLADGITPIGDGDFITVAQGEAGLRFVPDTGSARDGSFHAEASENGVTVAAQSGAAVSTIPVRLPDLSPDLGFHESEVNSAQQATDVLTKQDTLFAEIEETETVAVTPETVDALEEGSGNTLSQTSGRTSREEETPRSGGTSALNNVATDAVETINDQTDEAGVGEESRGRLIALAAKTRNAMLMAQQSRLLGMNFNTTGLAPLAEENYEYVRKALDALEEEIGNEIRLSRTLLGSAMATSVGLSAGYVIWMLKGGSLLASVLASVPAWQIADPLAILAGSRRDDDEDDESLETIIDDAPDQRGVSKGMESNDETKTADETM